MAPANDRNMTVTGREERVHSPTIVGSDGSGVRQLVTELMASTWAL
jgi:hypothetical protein